MTKRLYILSCFAIVFFNSNSQEKKQQEQFYRQFDNCRFDGNSINDYVVKLFNDSTIEIQIYFRTCINNHVFYKTTYHGRFVKKNDTCTVSYLAGYTEKKDRYRADVVKSDIKPEMMFLNFPFNFFVRNGFISATNLLFSDLPSASISEVKAMEIAFYQWNRQSNHDVLGVLGRLKKRNEQLFPFPQFNSLY